MAKSESPGNLRQDDPLHLHNPLRMEEILQRALRLPGLPWTQDLRLGTSHQREFVDGSLLWIALHSSGKW